MGSEVNHSVRVAILVIVPTNDLEEVAVEADTGLGVEDGASWVAEKVSAD